MICISEGLKQVGWRSGQPPGCEFDRSQQNQKRFHLTTRWSGPGIRRQKQELIEMSVIGLRREGAIPGRSARSR